MFSPGDLICQKKGSNGATKRRYIVLEMLPANSPDEYSNNQPHYLLWNIKHKVVEYEGIRNIDGRFRKIGERPYGMYKTLYSGGKNVVSYTGTVTGRFSSGVALNMQYDLYHIQRLYKLWMNQNCGSIFKTTIRKK